mgnify:CR=1 FL=1
MSWKESYSDQIENLISYSKLIYQRGLVSAAGGNISARCGRHVLITGSNIPLRTVTPEGLVLCDGKRHCSGCPPLICVPPRSLLFILASTESAPLHNMFCMLTLCFPRFGPCKIRSFPSTQNPPN